MRTLQQIITASVALAAWAGAASASPPPDIDDDPPAPATWILIEARNHISGRSGLAAVLFGAAEERGRRRQASLVVHCFDDRTTARVDTAGLRPGPAAVAVRHSLDGRPFAAGAWETSADGGGLALSGDPAVTFVSALYGRSTLRLAVVRPLSVPFVVTFAVGGAELSLRPLAERCHWSGGPSISAAGH